MSYERMTGMGFDIDISSLNIEGIEAAAQGSAGGTQTEEYKQCKAAGNRIGSDYSIPEGCIPSGTWSAVGRSMPEHGYCCPGERPDPLSQQAALQSFLQQQAAPSAVTEPTTVTNGQTQPVITNGQPQLAMDQEIPWKWIAITAIGVGALVWLLKR